MNALQRHQREIEIQRRIIRSTKHFPHDRKHLAAQKRLAQLLTSPQYEDAMDEAREMMEEVSR